MSRLRGRAVRRAPGTLTSPGRFVLRQKRLRQTTISPCFPFEHRFGPHISDLTRLFPEQPTSANVSLKLIWQITEACNGEAEVFERGSANR